MKEEEEEEEEARSMWQQHVAATGEYGDGKQVERRAKMKREKWGDGLNLTFLGEIVARDKGLLLLV